MKPTCPSCKREIQPDFLMCPYCGYRLDSKTPASLLYRKGGRSAVLTVITALTFVGGVIDILQGASESTYDYALYLYPVPSPQLASVLLLAGIAFGVLLVIVGITQLVVAYGLVSGKSSSRRYLLRLTSIAFLLSLLELSSDTVISGMVSLARATFTFDIFFVLWSLFLLGVIWRYVSQQDERDILSMTGPIEVQG